MAKANKKAIKPAQPAKVKFEDQFYPSGKPYIVHEVDQNGNGVLKVYSEDEVLNSERKITNYKVDLRHLKLYETDEQGRLIVTLCELYEEKKVRFALAFYEDQLIEASVFDRFGMSVVPWAVFDEDGQVNFDDFHYNFDRMPVYAADDATFEEYSNSEEGENDAAQLRIELAKDDAEASHKILEDEAAFTALLRHNLDLSHSMFSEEELDTLLVKQFKVFCEDEVKRRAAGTKTTLRLFTQAIPALLKLK